MDLDNFLPKNKEVKINGNRVFLKKLVWLPFLDYIDELIFIYLDLNLCKEIIRTVDKLKSENISFYFKSVKMSDPGLCLSTDDYNSDIIRTYFKAYSSSNFYDGFKKIDFDFIQNMVDFCEREKCYHLIKDIYQEININVQKKYYDYYAGKSYFLNKREDIREDFDTLYREIQLNKIIGNSYT
jgi:hypothetical protein